MLENGYFFKYLTTRLLLLKLKMKASLALFNKFVNSYSFLTKLPIRRSELRHRNYSGVTDYVLFLFIVFFMFYANIPLHS